MTDTLKEKLNEKPTEELLEILSENNRLEWRDEAFKMIRQILAERGEEVPEEEAIEPKNENKYSKPFGALLTASIVFGLFRYNLLKTMPELSDYLAIASLVLWLITGILFSKSESKSGWWGIIGSIGIPGLILLFIIFRISNKIRGSKKNFEPVK